MNTISAIGISGLAAAQTRLAGTASNIANVATTGPVPTNSPGQPITTPAVGSTGDQVYQAVDPQTQDLGGGGVVSRLAPGLPSYVQQFQPDSPDADAQGLVAAPAVNLDTSVTALLADSAYAKANLAVVKVGSEIQQDTLNLLS